MFEAEEHGVVGNRRALYASDHVRAGIFELQHANFRNWEWFRVGVNGDLLTEIIRAVTNNGAPFVFCGGSWIIEISANFLAGEPIRIARRHGLRTQIVHCNRLRSFHGRGS